MTGHEIEGCADCGTFIDPELMLLGAELCDTCSELADMGQACRACGGLIFHPAARRLGVHPGCQSGAVS